MNKLQAEIQQLTSQITGLEQALALAEQPIAYKTIDETGLVAYLQQQLSVSVSEEERRSKIKIAQSALAEARKLLKSKQSELAKLEQKCLEAGTRLGTLADRVNELSASLDAALLELRQEVAGIQDTWWTVKRVVPLEDNWGKRRLPCAQYFEGDFVKISERTND